MPEHEITHVSLFSCIQSEGSTSQQSGQDSKRSPRSRKIRGDKKFSVDGSQGSGGGQISRTSRGNGIRGGQLSLFPADSPAHLTVRPGSDSARKILVTSGRRWRGSYECSSPLGLLLRTLLERSAWSSMMRLLIWKKQATPCGRSYFRLSPSRRGMSDKDCLLLPTLTARDGHPKGSGWYQSPSPGARRRPSLYLMARLGILPTLRANDVKGGKYQRDPHGEKKRRMTLCGILPTLTKSMATPADMVQAQYSGTDPRRPTYQEAKMMPTLLKRDQRCLSSAAPRPRQDGGPNLVQVSGGKLGADWCEWYMGFPVGWTDIDGDEFLPSATPVSRRKSTRSCRRSRI